MADSTTLRISSHVLEQFAKRWEELGNGPFKAEESAQKALVELFFRAKEAERPSLAGIADDERANDRYFVLGRRAGFWVFVTDKTCSTLITVFRKSPGTRKWPLKKRK